MLAGVVAGAAEGGDGDGERQGDDDEAEDDDDDESVGAEDGVDLVTDRVDQFRVDGFGVVEDEMEESAHAVILVVGSVVMRGGGEAHGVAALADGEGAEGGEDEQDRAGDEGGVVGAGGVEDDAVDEHGGGAADLV